MSDVRATEAQLLRAAMRLGEPGEGLQAVAELRVRLDTLEAAHVDEAIAAGWSWTSVARALGVTKQAAHARHARRAKRVQQGLVVAGRARQVVQRARNEAAALGAPNVESDHILLSLLREEAGAVREALEACGISYDAVRARAAPPGASAKAPGRVPAVSPGTREVLEQSMREAVARGDGRLDVEHLLLAVLHQPGGRGQGAVLAGGRTPAAIERRLSRALRDQVEEPASSEASSPASP
jgi:hypothetical protein